MATNRKSVPRKPIYFSGWGDRLFDLFFDRRDYDFQKVLPADRFKSVESLRVMSFEPTASTNISPHVNTIVPLSLTPPCRQKIISSGLRRDDWPPVPAGLLMAASATQPRARHHKSEKTQ